MSTTAHSTAQHSDAPYTDTVQGAAQFSGLSEWTIRSLVREGRLDVKYHGRRVLVVRKSLVSYLEGLPSERPAD